MIFVALVTIEHDTDSGDYLPSDVAGSCGWMAVRARNERKARDSLQRMLEDIGLKVVAIDRVEPVQSPSEIESYDSYLADNVRAWEAGKDTVWGTIHCYKNVDD